LRTSRLVAPGEADAAACSMKARPGTRGDPVPSRIPAEPAHAADGAADM
jgi:hypothetical protein